jgi:Flp pilus assembly pilin Flp
MFYCAQRPLDQPAVHRSVTDVRKFIHSQLRILEDDSGTTAIEYALIASIVGLAMIPVILNTTTGVASLYTRVQGYFDMF